MVRSVYRLDSGTRKDWFLASCIVGASLQKETRASREASCRLAANATSASVCSL